MRRIVLCFAVALSCLWAPAAVRADDAQIVQTITTRINQEDEAGNLRGYNLGLKVDEGTVWLSGTVSQFDQQALVLDIARRIPGVVQVVNAIEIESAQAAPAPQQAAAPQPAPALTAPQPQPVPTQAAPRYAAPAQPAAYGSGVSQAAVPQAAPQPVRAAQATVPGAGYPAMAPVPMSNAPAPAYVPGTGQGVRPATYDHPNMPGYAWPSYAAHPNYAAVTYPQQYSAAAWPYIGPFYPYPQVPLGWRKVTLEWDDGWWFLDFDSSGR